MSERILPRPALDDVDNAGDNLAHVFCHRCNDLERNGQRVTIPVTSLCGQFHGVPRRGASKMPMCVVCSDIADTGQCRHGHPMRPMKEIINRDRP